jgi:RNase adaptor protein for sRNA GlmZ degradation
MAINKQVRNSNNIENNIKSAIDEIKKAEKNKQITFLQAKELCKITKYYSEIIYNLILY